MLKMPVVVLQNLLWTSIRMFVKQIPMSRQLTDWHHRIAGNLRRLVLKFVKSNRYD